MHKVLFLVSMKAHGWADSDHVFSYSNCNQWWVDTPSSIRPEYDMMEWRSLRTGDIKVASRLQDARKTWYRMWKLTVHPLPSTIWIGDGRCRANAINHIQCPSISPRILTVFCFPIRIFYGQAFRSQGTIVGRNWYIWQFTFLYIYTHIYIIYHIYMYI